jgi:hypothetical protein
MPNASPTTEDTGEFWPEANIYDGIDVVGIQGFSDYLSGNNPVDSFV